MHTKKSCPTVNIFTNLNGVFSVAAWWHSCSPKFKVESQAKSRVVRDWMGDTNICYIMVNLCTLFTEVGSGCLAFLSGVKGKEPPSTSGSRNITYEEFKMLENTKKWFKQLRIGLKSRSGSRSLKNCPYRQTRTGYRGLQATLKHLKGINSKLKNILNKI